MFYHVKELKFNARITEPTPRFASLLLAPLHSARSKLKMAGQDVVQLFRPILHGHDQPAAATPGNLCEPMVGGTGVSGGGHGRERRPARWIVVSGPAVLVAVALIWRWLRHPRPSQKGRFAGIAAWMAGQGAREQRIGTLESRWVEVNGQMIHVRTSMDPVPAGKLPVVLVHGLPMSSLYMVPLAARLAPDFQVYAPDLPGFGKSVTPQRALSIPELADALAAWMRVAGLEKAALVGNSFGCQVIAHFAVRHPQHVARVVLEDPTMSPRAREIPNPLKAFTRVSAMSPRAREIPLSAPLPIVDTSMSPRARDSPATVA